MVALIQAREDEAARVSRILHDQIGQVLSAVGLHLGVLRQDFGELAPEIVDRTNEIQDLLETALAQIRDLSFELNPAIAERAGLRFALERLVGRVRQSYSGSLRLLFDSKVHLPAATGNAFYRITECALDNAVKHARATKIEVLVRPTRGSVTMEVRDNGAGFDAAAADTQPAGVGLPLTKHFANSAGLSLSVTSRLGKGTIIKVIYPTPPPDQLAGGAGKGG